MIYLIYWDYNNILVESAESSKFRTLYEYGPDDLRNYTPDFYLPDLKELYEIKPEFMQKNKIVLNKFEALLKNNPNIECIMTGYNEIDEFKHFIIDNGYFKKLLMNDIHLSDKQLSRLLKNYPGIKNET